MLRRGHISISNCTYFYQCTSLSPVRSTRTSINIHPFPLYAAHVVLSIYISFPSTQHTYFCQCTSLSPVRSTRTSIYTSLSPLRSTRTSINIHPFPLYAALVLLSIYISFPSTHHMYFCQYTSLSPLRSTRTSINMHPLPLYAAHVLLSIYIPFRSTQHTLWKVSDLVYDVFFSRILKIWAL